MPLKRKAQIPLIAVMLFAASLAVAADVEDYEEKYDALVQLYRLGHAAFLYAPYPVARDALEEVAVAQESFVGFLQRMTPTPDDGKLSAAHISSMVDAWLEYAAVDYYRLYVLEAEFGNPSQAQYYLNRALSLMGGPEYEAYLNGRASMASQSRYERYDARISDFCYEVFRRVSEAARSPEPIRVYRPEPNDYHSLSELGPPLLPSNKPLDYSEQSIDDEGNQ
jgi:hypothetical protein